MDSRELFRQLTCGATFTKSLTNVPKSSANDLEKVKQEPNIQISKKKKIRSISESADNLNLIDGMSFPKKKPKAEMTEEKLKMLEIERINQIRNVNHINVTGKHIPPPIETFDQLASTYQVSSQIIDNLKSCGYSSPTPIQMQAMPIMLQNNSLLACAPTGSGKTAAFLLPIIHCLKKPKQKGFRAMVLCPTRELAKQTQRECLKLVETIGLRVHVLSKTNRAEYQYGEKSNQRFDILITTPNRVCYLLDQDPPILNLSNIKWLILDEADKLFEEGKNSFREQFDRIYLACSSNKKKVGLFSATWTNLVARWQRKNLKQSSTIAIGQRNTATDLIDQQLLFVGSEPGKLLAFKELLKGGLNPPVLVFVESKDRAQQLFSELKTEKIHVDIIHSDLTQQQRDDVVKAFREGKCWILICTEIISRGIDFKGVNLVVNYDFPQSTIAYIHRIGRTGRAGRRGQAITYFTKDDTIHLKSIAKIIKNSGGHVPEFILKMKDHSKIATRKLEKERNKRADIREFTTYGVPKVKKVQKKFKKKISPKGSDNVMTPRKNYVSLNQNGKRNGTAGPNVTAKKKKVN